MDNYLKKLEDFESTTLEEYLSDYNQQLVVERLLQLIIQVALDINRYCLKRLKIKQPQDNVVTFIEVSRLGIITPELAENLAESAGLRNRLVHVYEEIDPVKVHAAIGLRNRLVHVYEEIDPVKVHAAIQKALQYYPIYQRQVTSYLDALEENA